MTHLQTLPLCRDLSSSRFSVKINRIDSSWLRKMRKILKKLELETLSVLPSDITSSFPFQRHIIVQNKSPKMKRLAHDTLQSEIKTSTETVAMTIKATTTRASTMQYNRKLTKGSSQSRRLRRIPAKTLSSAFLSSSPSLSSSWLPSKRNPQTLSVFLLFQILLSFSSAFNVETSFPVIHQGVGVDQNSFFGFSISQFKSQGENYILVGAPRHHHHSAPSPFSSSSSSSSSSPPPTPSTGRGALFRCRANPFTDSFGAQQLCQDLKIDEDVSDRVTQSQEVRMW